MAHKLNHGKIENNRDEKCINDPDDEFQNRFYHHYTPIRNIPAMDNQCRKYSNITDMGNQMPMEAGSVAE